MRKHLRTLAKPNFYFAAPHYQEAKEEAGEWGPHRISHHWVGQLGPSSVYHGPGEGQGPVPFGPSYGPRSLLLGAELRSGLCCFPQGLQQSIHTVLRVNVNLLGRSLSNRSPPSLLKAALVQLLQVVSMKNQWFFKILIPELCMRLFQDHPWLWREWAPMLWPNIISQSTCANFSTHFSHSSHFLSNETWLLKADTEKTGQKL